MLIANREGFAATARKRLPYDAEVEYLESTGTQCIDTGVFLNGALAIELSFRPADTSVRPCGAADVRVSPSLHQWCLVDAHTISSNVCVGTGNNLLVVRISTVGNDIKMKMSGRTLTVNGTVATNSTWTLPDEDTNVTLGLFGCHVARAGNVVNWALLATMRLYSARILDGNSVIHDYVPVRAGSVGYLYDRITGQLLGNGGTGNFVLGEDKPKLPAGGTMMIANRESFAVAARKRTPTARDYVQSGLVAMWDAIENAANYAIDKERFNLP